MRIFSHSDKTARATSKCFAPGAVLLEVVLAITIFVFAAAVVQFGLVRSLRSVTTLRLENLAVDLAVTKLSEIQMNGDAGVIDAGPGAFLDAEGNEDEALEDWQWRVATEALGKTDESSGMARVTVTVSHVPSGISCQLVQLMGLADEEEQDDFLSDYDVVEPSSGAGP